MEDAQAAPEAAPEFVLEADRRLSSSFLWQLQRDFFDRKGVDAWRHGAVPCYVTSNPFIARAYARVVFGFLRDCRATQGTDFPPLDPSRPVYVVELGAGPGLFAFHFLREFFKMLARSPLRDVRVTYVMTDFTERNLEFWRAQPSLRPFVDAGQLDFARFDAGQDRQLALDRCGAVLSRETLTNPLVVIANYVFDTLPEDVFCVEDGELYEGLLTVRAAQAQPDLTDPEELARLNVTCRFAPARTDYYGDAELDALLESYRRQLSNTTFLFPCAAMQCVRSLAQLSGDRLLLLSGDKAYSRAQDLIAPWGLGLVLHDGSFSMMVNFHALGQYVARRGGRFLQTAHHYDSLNICAFLLGQPPGDFVETRLAYEAAIEQGSPDDFFTLRGALEAHSADLTLPQILAYLRLSGWDAEILGFCLEAIVKGLDEASPPQREELYWAIRQVWDAYYPIGEDNDVALNLATLLFAMEYYRDALGYIQHSLRLRGPDAGVLHNAGMCHYYLRELDTALEYFNQALALDPALATARAMRIKVEAELGRQ